MSDTPATPEPDDEASATPPLLAQRERGQGGDGGHQHHSDWERDPGGKEHVGVDDQPAPDTESPLPNWEHEPDGEDPVTAGDEPSPIPETYPEPSATAPLLAQRERGPGGEGDPDSQPSPFFAWGYDGAPIVFAIHDAGYDLRMWHTLGQRLAEAYQLIAIDLPGHGTEPPPDFAWSIEDAAFAARELLANAGIEIAAVVGCGIGARIAAEIAIQQPGLVAALVLADLPATGPELETTRDLIERRGPAELGKRHAATMSAPFHSHAIRDRYSRVSRDGFLSALNALAEAPPPDAATFAAVDAPVLVCASQEHPGLPALRSFARELDAARLLTFRECDASAVHGRPADFADQVFRFLRAVEEGETVSGERTI